MSLADSIHRLIRTEIALERYNNGSMLGKVSPPAAYQRGYDMTEKERDEAMARLVDDLADRRILE